MKLTDLFERVENHPDFKSYVDKIIKKNKKTHCAYLESLTHLAYLLYLNGQEELSRKLLEIMIQVPFEGDYKSWTYIDSSLVLLAYMERNTEDLISNYKNILLSPLNQGDELTKKVKKRVHQRFLNGDTLNQKLAKIEQSSSMQSELEYRLLYLTDLLRLYLFIADSPLDKKDIQAKIEENMEMLKKSIKEQGIYSFFPFKG